MRGYVARVLGTCGLGVVYGFNMPHDYTSEVTPRNIKFAGGIGYNVAGFVDSDNCKQMYDWIKENYTIVFQSPVKRNKNSGRMFFFIVFKEKSK